MTYLIIFEKYSSDHRDIKDIIQNLHGISKENKEIALGLLQSYTSAGKGKIFELQLHPDLIKKIKEHGAPSGFSMGIDKNGFFIQTHRARSKSYEKPDDITIADMKFIDSTG